MTLEKRRVSKTRNFIYSFLAYLVIPLACTGIAYFVVVKSQPESRSHNTNYASRLYGDKAPNLCEKATQDGSGTLPQNAHFAFIDSYFRTLVDYYNDALPADMHATSAADLTAVVCLDFIKRPYETTTACTSYMSNIEATVVNVSTGQTVAYKLIEGEKPAPCNPNVEGTRSAFDAPLKMITGDMPAPDRVFSWLKQLEG
jgi:hypothetical protein